MSTYLERMKKKKEEEQSPSYSTYLERKEAKNILNGTDTFLQDYSTLVNNHNQTLKDTNNFLKSNELTNDNLHSNIINDSDNYNNLKDKLSKFRNEFVSRYGEKSVSKMEDRLSNLGQSIKSNSKAIENIMNGKNVTKQEEEKQSDALFPGQKTQSNKVSSLEVNEAKQLTGKPTDILFNNPATAEQDEALVMNTRGYANKYANMSYAQIKDTVAKNSDSMSNEEKNFVTKFTTNKLSKEGTAEDIKNEYEQLIKNGADENSPEVSHLKEMYQNKYDSEVYNKLSNLSDDDVIKALDNDITVGYGADTKTQNWVTKDHLKYDDVKSYITNYGSLSLLKKYRDYLKDNGEYTERNELAHSLLGDTSIFDSTKNKNEDEINQLNDIITIREQEKNVNDKYADYSQNSDWDKLSKLSDDDIIKALDNDITVGYGADTKTQNWVQKDHLKYDDVKSYITKHGSLSLLKKYRDYLKENGEYTERNELAHFLFGDTSVFDSTKNKNEDEINKLDDIIKIREQVQNDDEPKTSSESELTKEEAVYNYIYNKYGEEKANDYKNSISKYSNYVTAQEERQKTQEYAKEHPVLGTLKSVLTNLGNTLSLLPLADIVDNTIGIDIDVNDDLHTASRKTNDLREGAKSNLGETGQFIYDTAMSAVDSASYVAMGNALGVAGEAVGIANATNYVPEIVNGLMGNIVAQQAIIEGKEKGYSDTKAVSMGIIQAAIEAITEQYSLDTIIKHPSLLKGALVEGSEEVASNWLNNVVDAVANGDKNRYRQAIDEYRKENPNASDGEALASAICDSFKDDGLSFIAGGLSGASMSGTQMGVNKLKQHSAANQFKNSQIEVLDNIINDEKFSDTEFQHQASVLKNKVNNNEEITRTDELKLQNAQMRTALKNIVPEEVINNTAAKTDIEVATENGTEKVKASFGTKHPNGILATVDGTDTKAVTNIVSSNSGKMTLQTDTGDTVQLEDVQFNSPSQKAIFEQASKYDANGAKQYVIAVDNFKGKSEIFNKAFNKAFDALYKLGNSGYDYDGKVENVSIKADPEQASHYVYDNAINPSSSEEELPHSQQKLIADAEKARKVLGMQSMNVVNAGWNDYISAKNENKRLLQLTKDTYEHYNTLADIAQEEVAKQQSDELLEQQNEEPQEKEPIKLPKNESDKLYNELVNKFKGREDEFTDLWGKAYYAGARGVSYNSVAKNINYLDVIRQIGSKDVQRIMEAGRRDSVAEVKALMQNSKPQKKTSGKVVVAESAKKKVKNTAVFEHIANNIGTDIYVEDIKDKRINGYIDKDGIHLNANHDQEGMLFAVCHEAIHKLKLSNIQGYTELKNFVMDVLTDSGMNIDSRTMNVINNYLETNSLNRDNLTEEAEEEIVANAFGSIISNEQAMNKAYALSSDKKSHLVSAIKSIINKLKEFLNKLSDHMPEVKALKDNINAQIKMAEIFAKNVEQSNSNTDSKNKKYLYLGTESKTANISNLNKAKEMEEDGASSESIRKTTGWFKSYDGKWRYEISDKDIQYSRDGKFTNDPQLKRKNELFNKFLMGTITSEEMNEYSNLNSNRAVKPIFLSDFVKHDKLFKSYPQLKDLTLSIDSDMSGKEKGFYDNGLKEIHINSKLTGDEAVKTIIHEVQHAIQHIEKFATGANGSNENYNRVAGEIEARDSAHRSNFTEEQRKNIRPDIDRTDVAFAKNSNMNLSIRKNKDGDKVVVINTNNYIFDNVPVKNMANVARKYMNEHFKDTVLELSEYGLVHVGRIGIGKYFASNNKYNKDIFIAKTKASTELDNLLSAAKYIDQKSDSKNHRFAKEGFEYFKTIFIVDNNVFEGIIDIGYSDLGIEFYGMSNIKRVTSDIGKYANLLLDNYTSDSKFRSNSKNNISLSKISVNDNFADESRKLGANLPGKKFSIFEGGTDKNLVAMHNLSADNLETALNRGGFPIPSIAVTKDNISHNDFGEVSVLFDKDTIDPEINNNHVYGSDVYSPTHPGLEYKVNENKSKEVYDYFKDELKNKDMAFKVNPVNFSSANLSKKINSLKGEENYIKSFENDYGMKNLFLSLSNNQVDKVNDIERTEVKDVDELTADFYNYLYDTMGQKIETVRNMVGRNWYKENKEQFKSVVQSYVNSENDSNIRAKKKALVDKKTSSGFASAATVKNVINFKDNNGKIVKTETVSDVDGAKKEIDKRINQKDYEQWLKDTFNGIVEKTGIRKPNVDAYTSRGDRKSFEQLHYSDTLDNIVKAMKDVQNGESFFGGNQLWAIGSKEYSSIKDIKGDSSRLQMLSDEEHSEIKSELGVRFQNIAKELVNNTDLMSLDSAYNNIADAVRHSKNENQMLKYLKEYYPKTATSEIVSEIVNLLDDVSNMPTGYFEAKPQRVISPSEIKAVVIPSGTSANVIELLQKNNIPYYEYSSDENRTVATQQAINDTKIRFSKFSDKIKKEETRSEKALKMTNETLSELLNMTEEKGFVDDDKVYQEVAKKILKKYNCNFSSKTFAENVKTVMNYANNQKVLDNNDYINQLTYVANEALDKHRSIKDNFAEERKVVNDYFNKKNLLLSNKQKEILDFGIGANTFINKMYGMANIVTDSNLLSSDSNTMYLKEAYESLQDELGIDFLPMATEEEMPKRLLQLKELLKPQINIDGMNRYDVSMNMVQDFVTELAKSKYSNKNTEITKKINQLVSQQKQWNNELKKEYNQKLREEKKKYENNLKKYQSEVGEYKQRTTYEKHQKINDLRAKQKDTLELYKDRRMQTVYKDKIRRMCSRLGKMINTEIRKEGIPMPTNLIRTMSSLADIIDPGTTRNGNIVTGYSTFMKLKSIYDGLQEADNEANQGSAEGIYALHYQKAISNLIEELAVQIDETPLNKLNGYQLKKVYDTLHMVENNFRDAKKVIVKGKTIEYSKLGIQTIYDLRDVRGNLRKNSDKNKWIVPKLNRYANYLLDFTRFIKKVVGYNEEDPLYKQAMEFDKADSKEAKIRMESKQTFEDVFAKMEATKAEGYKHKSVLDVFDGKDAKMLDFGLKDRFTGEPVKISAAMAVSIYQMSMNEDNKRHFVLGQRNVDVPGGLNIPNNALWQKGKKTEARSQHHTVVMSEEILDKISKYVINNELLLELSNATDKFFNEVSRKYIDETAKRLYGYPISIESHYFPINTNKNYIKTEFETVVLNASLENKGFTKHRTNGHNPIWLDDVTEVINNHMNGLAKYAAYTPIIRDFKKVYNYTASDYQTSVKDEIEKRWGASATQYIDNFMKDLQKPYTSNPGFSKWRGRFAQAVLAMNLSVTMKQAASYPTAAAVIGYKPLAKALLVGDNAEGEKKILFYRANRAEINSMTGVFFDRYQGDNTAEMREFITDNGWAKKVPYLMNWIQKADVATTGRLWQACKYYVEEKLKIQKYKENGKEYTDEYKEALVDTYEKVIKNTQPMYSTVHRPAVLRSHNELMRTLTMFLTQRLQNFGIMVEATGNYRAKAKAYYSSKTEANKIALDKAKKQFVRSISSQIVAGMTLSAMALLYNAIIHRLDRYKDDEGELTWLSILSTFSSDFMETMSGCVLWGSEAYEVISNIIKVSNGGTVYNSDIVDLGAFNTINDIQDAIIGMLRTCFADEFDESKFNKYSYKIASGVAKVFGIPLDNAKNIIMGGVNLVKDCVDNGSPLAFKAGSNISLSTSDYAEHLYEYLINNDKEGYTKLYNKAMADGIDSKKIQTAIKEQLVGNEFVQKAAVALHNDDIGTYESSSRVLILQGFDADTVKKAVDYYISHYLEKEEDKKKTKIKDDYTEKELFDNNEGQTAQYSFDDLWRAKENDSSSYQTIYDALIEQGKKPSAIKSAMKAREKKKKEKEEQNN